METKKMSKIESLKNSNNQFPIYRTKYGRTFLGLYRNLNKNSVIGLVIPDADRVECSESHLEDTGEFGDRIMRSIIKTKFILNDDDLEEFYN